MIYKCEFPCCNFTTEERDRIDRHHIIPRDHPQCTNLGRNLLWLCPNHHRAIYIPYAQHGHHSIINKDSIVVIDKVFSNKGYVLRYRRCSDMLLRHYHAFLGWDEVIWEDMQLDLWQDPNNFYEV